jgi:hypothetical protein
LEQLSNEVWRLNLTKISKGIKERVLGSLGAFSGVRERERNTV